MAEKMLVTQALDERDLLEKKINRKIDSFKCVDYARNNEEKCIKSQKIREEFTAEAKASCQQIMDLIARHQRIEAAIIASNAAAIIKTSFGEYTVAAAIALRNRIREKKGEQELAVDKLRNVGTDLWKGSGFEERLVKTMIKQYFAAKAVADLRNNNLEGQAKGMRLIIVGKDSKVKDDRALAVVDAYINENRTELIDPLETLKKAEELRMKSATFRKEIDTQIKISNATTLIEID